MTMTETEPLTYSTEEAALAAGVTYRMIDHWLRQGTIQIGCDPTPGSGNRRRFTAAEVEALVAVVEQYRAAQAIVRDFQTGLLWEITRTEQLMEEEAVDVE